MASAPPRARIQRFRRRSGPSWRCRHCRSEQRAPVGRQAEHVGAAVAVDTRGVYAGLALDRVVVVAEVPVEEVVAGAQQGKVVAVAADDVVVAAALPIRVSAPKLPKSCSASLPAASLLAVDGVVAGVAEDIQDVRLVGMKNADLGGQTADDDLGADGCDLDAVGIAVAVDADPRRTSCRPAAPPEVPARSTTTAVTSVPARPLTRPNPRRRAAGIRGVRRR